MLVCFCFGSKVSFSGLLVLEFVVFLFSLENGEDFLFMFWSGLGKVLMRSVVSKLFFVEIVELEYLIVLMWDVMD